MLGELVQTISTFVVAVSTTVLVAVGIQQAPEPAPTPEPIVEVSPSITPSATPVVSPSATPTGLPSSSVSPKPSFSPKPTSQQEAERVLEYFPDETENKSEICKQKIAELEADLPRKLSEGKGDPIEEHYSELQKIKQAYCN